MDYNELYRWFMFSCILNVSFMVLIGSICYMADYE